MSQLKAAGGSERIHIFGASGSGTTTLGAAVAETIRVPLLDVDSYFWMETDPPFTTKRPPEARFSALEGDLDDDIGWVISGSMCGWGDPLIPRFTLAVFLYTDPEVRMRRLSNRERALFGSRIDEGGDMYRIHREFMDWASRYDSAGMEMRSLRIHETWIRSLDCQVLRLNGEDPVEELTMQVVDACMQNRGD